MSKSAQQWIVEEWEHHLVRAEQAREYRAKKRELAKVGRRPGAYMGYLPTATWLRRVLFNRFGWSLTSQNLNEDRQGHYEGQFWYGRAWLSRWDHKKDDRGFHSEFDWKHGRKVDDLSLLLIIGGGENGDSVTLAISIPRLFSYWLSLRGVIRGTYRGYEHDSREFGFSVFEDHVSLKWHYHDSGDWYSDKAKNKAANPGFYASFFWKDKLLGKAKYSTAVVQEERTVIPMPEGPYEATVRIERATWKRTRWPFARVVYRAHIEPDKGVGVPGKGENAWDIDDDAIYSMTTPAASVPAAVAAFVESSLSSRERYGGKNWKPE